MKAHIDYIGTLPVSPFLVILQTGLRGLYFIFLPVAVAPQPHHCSPLQCFAGESGDLNTVGQVKQNGKGRKMSVKHSLYTPS